MFADMFRDKTPNPLVAELIIRWRKLNFSLVFITKSYFANPKNIRLNSTCYFVMEIPNKRELQQTAFNHSPDVDFINFYKEIKTIYCIDTTNASDISSLFRKYLLERI